MDGNLFNVQFITKNRQTSDSFSAHYKQKFKYNTSHADLRKIMSFKAYMGISRSPLPLNNGNLTLPFFGGN